MDIFILVILMFMVLIMTAMTILLATFNFTHLFGAPFVATRRKIVKEMLEFADLKKGETFMDLGSGTGSILMVATKNFGTKKAIGYEINPFLVWASNWRARLAGVSGRMKTKRINFFKSRIEDVDVVAVYLWPETMDKLRKKLKNDLSPNTRIISRGFVFSDVEPRKSIDEGLSGFHLYRVSDL